MPGIVCGVWGVTRTRFGVGVLFRRARVAVRVTPAQRRRCFGLLRSGGDVWAALIEVNQVRFRRQAKPIFGYENWCQEIAGVTVGELSVTAMRSVVRRTTGGYGPGGAPTSWAPSATKPPLPASP